MKKILGLLLFTTQAFSATLRTNSDQQFLNANAPRNYILNSGAEKNDANITDSSSIHTRSTSSPLMGEGSHAIDATGSGQNVDFLAANFDSILLNTNCEASFYYSGDASLYTAEMRINGTTVSAVLTLTNVSSGSQPASLNFPCSSVTSPVLRIASTSASAAAIKLDNVYVGRATNLYDVNSVTSWESWTPTGTWTTNTTYTGKRRFVGDTMEAEVKVTLSGAPDATTLVINMPTGLVIDTNKFLTTASVDLMMTEGIVTILDSGTSAYSGGMVYLTSTTIKPAAFAVSGTRVNDWNSITHAVPFTFASGDTISMRFSVPIVGRQSEIAIRPDQAGLTPRVSYTPVVSGLGTGSTTTMVGWEQRVGDTIEGQIDYIQNAAGSGTTNVSWTAPRTLDTAKAQSIGGVYYVGYARVYDIATLSSGVDDRTYPVYYSSGSFQIVRPASAGGAIRGQDLEAGAQLTIFFKYPVSGWTQTMPAPLLVGSVTSSSQGLIKVESARITNNGSACAANSEASHWVTSITRNATGRCSWTIPSGYFSGTPHCICTAQSTGSTQCAIDSNISINATSQGFITANSAGTNTDLTTNVICIGPR